MFRFVLNAQYKEKIVSKLSFIEATEEQKEQVRKVFEKYEKYLAPRDFSTIGIVTVLPSSSGMPPTWKARVRKVADDYAPFLPYKFLLQVYSYTYNLSDREFEAILFHEFLHIHPRIDGVLVKHNVEGFDLEFELFKEFATSGWGQDDIDAQKEDHDENN